MAKFKSFNDLSKSTIFVYPYYNANSFKCSTKCADGVGVANYQYFLTASIILKSHNDAIYVSKLLNFLLNSLKWTFNYIFIDLFHNLCIFIISWFVQQFKPIIGHNEFTQFGVIQLPNVYDLNISVLHVHLLFNIILKNKKNNFIFIINWIKI